MKSLAIKTLICTICVSGAVSVPLLDTLDGNRTKDNLILLDGTWSERSHDDDGLSYSAGKEKESNDNDLGRAALFAMSSYHKSDMENLETHGICTYRMFKDKLIGLDTVDIYGLEFPWVITAGSQTFVDWLQNFMIRTVPMGGGNVHRGFLRLAQALVKRIKGTYDPNRKIILAGHSLGGSVSILAGTILKSHGWDVKVFSFGSPRVGDKGWCNAINNSGLDLTQVVNVGDPIVCTPRGLFWKYDDLKLGLTGYDRPVCGWDWFKNFSLRAHYMSTYYEKWGIVPGMDEAIDALVLSDQ